jgi:DDE superfamily endonuclease
VVAGQATSHLGQLPARSQGCGQSLPRATVCTMVLDNLNIHKNQAAQRWPHLHPRVRFRCTPTHASWVNLVERSSASWASRVYRKVFIPPSASSRNFCWTILPVTTKIPVRLCGTKDRKDSSTLSRPGKNIKRRTRASCGSAAGLPIL